MAGGEAIDRHQDAESMSVNSCPLHRAISVNSKQVQDHVRQPNRDNQAIDESLHAARNAGHVPTRTFANATDARPQLDATISPLRAPLNMPQARERDFPRIAPIAMTASAAVSGAMRR
ncbi:hypothetical protein C7S18_15985 [Ahniella affigens]|uniref:Uncharacterized protein n=1 Tax=Ahniella affigens TaxID=2021234 RepID=A0A2P1PUR7_9GAMM|nr:hypothetical protein C7S18_15985 [Ahniella affigens]